MNRHILTDFDNDLNEIQQRVLLMAQHARGQAYDALESLTKRDLELAEKVIADDRTLNHYEAELNDICIQVISRHAPQANDLRLVIVAMQMTVDLERIGDEAKKIAKKARKIIRSADKHISPEVELRHVAEIAIAMLDRATDAFARRDITHVHDILRQDDTVNALFKSVMRQLITFMMEDPRMITRSIDFLFAAKAIERIGDHASNIAESVVYMVNGINMRLKTPPPPAVEAEEEKPQET